MKDGELVWDLEDDIVGGDEEIPGALITHEGEILHPKVREAMGLAALPKPQPAAEKESGEGDGEKKNEEGSK